MEMPARAGGDPDGPQHGRSQSPGWGPGTQQPFPTCICGRCEHGCVSAGWISSQLRGGAGAGSSTFCRTQREPAGLAGVQGLWCEGLATCPECGAASRSSCAGATSPSSALPPSLSSPLLGKLVGVVITDPGAELEGRCMPTHMYTGTCIHAHAHIHTGMCTQAHMHIYCTYSHTHTDLSGVGVNQAYEPREKERHLLKRVPGC